MRLSELQHQILDYLLDTGGDATRRWTALQDLRSRGLFDGWRSNKDVADMVNDYIANSGSYLCKEGIKRFRDALGIGEPPKAEEMHVVLKFKVDGDASSFNRFHLAEKMVGLFNATEHRGGRYISRCFDKGVTKISSEWGNYEVDVTYDGAQMITGVGTPQEQKQTIPREG